jgi:hypothetical protein
MLPAPSESNPIRVTVGEINKPNYSKIVLCILGYGNIFNIFQKRLPEAMGANVLSGNLTR